MVDETRQQLALVRTSQKHQLSSLTSPISNSLLTQTTHPLPVVSLHMPTATSDSFSEVEYPQLPTKHKKYIV